MTEAFTQEQIVKIMTDASLTVEQRAEIMANGNPNIRNGWVEPGEFYIRYDGGEFEDGAKTLDEQIQTARETFQSSKSLWRKVDGIYQNGVRVKSQRELDDMFEAEEDAERADEEDARSDYDEHNTMFGLPSRLPSAYRGGW